MNNPLSIYTLHDKVLAPALELLPTKFDTPGAIRMLTAIAQQESGIRYRRQMGGGPARGLWQFEMGGGVWDVMNKPSVAYLTLGIAQKLGIEYTRQAVHAALAENDVFAAVCARLLLWTVPEAMATHKTDGWDQYLKAWRPGKPHVERWNYAWELGESAMEYATATGELTYETHVSRESAEYEAGYYEGFQDGQVAMLEATSKALSSLKIS